MLIDKRERILFFFIPFFLAYEFCFAQNIEVNRRYQDRYFTIYYQSSLEPLEIARKIDPSLFLLKNNYGNSPEEILAKTVDNLFQEVSDILDIYLYNFKGNIRIFRDFQSLSFAFYQLYRQSLKSPSFYLYDTNTIYIAEDNLTPAMLGHEIAHAILNYYFVVPPPMKIQEVLAGYVEYQLRKKGK